MLNPVCSVAEAEKCSLFGYRHRIKVCLKRQTETSHVRFRRFSLSHLATISWSSLSQLCNHSMICWRRSHFSSKCKCPPLKEIHQYQHRPALKHTVRNLHIKQNVNCWKITCVRDDIFASILSPSWTSRQPITAQRSFNPSCPAKTLSSLPSDVEAIPRAIR